MDEKLRILILEDIPADAELVMRELSKAKINFFSKHVDTREAFIKELKDFTPDIILSDYQMPNFTGMEALKLAQELTPDIPVIIVTGSMNEETAVDCIKAGAADYVIKTHLIRIGPAIKGALEKREEKKEKEKLEKMILDSAKQWRTTFDSISDAVCLLDTEGIILRCNQSMKTLLNKPFNEIIGQHCYKLMHNSNDFIENCPMKQMLNTHLREKLELKLDDKWFHVSVDPIFDESNNLFKAVHIIIDIMERKQAEEALRESEARYRALFENTAEGILIADIKTKKFMYANPAQCRILGYTRDELTQMSVNNIHPPRDLEWVLSEFMAQARGDKIVSLNVPCLRKDGTILYVDISTTMIVIDGKECNVGFFSDITERKRAEQELLFKTTLLEAESETSIDGILAVNTEEKIILFNKRFAEMWNIPYEILDTKDDKQLLQYILNQLKDPDSFIKKVVYLYSHKEEKSRDEIELKNGKVFDRYSSPLVSSKGEYYGIIWYFHDITESKQLEKEIQWNYQAQYVLNTILYLSHKDISLIEFLKRSLDILFTTSWLDIEKKGSIFLVEDEQDVLVMKAQKGLPEPILKECKRIPFSKCHCGQVALTQKVRFSSSLDDCHTVKYDGILPHGHYCVPIIVSGKTIGVLNTYVKEGHSYSEKEEMFLVAIANTLGGIIRRKKMEEEILALAKFPNENPQPVIRAQKDGKIIFANDASIQLLIFWNVRAGDFLPKEIVELISEIYESNSKKYIQISCDDTIYSLLFVPLIDAGYVNIYGNDVTDLKYVETVLEKERNDLEHTVKLRTKQLQDSLKKVEEINRQLQEVNVHKNKFLSTMSHELRTPLNAIIGFTDLLAGQFFGPLNEKQISYVKQVDSSSKHLLSLITDLLDIAKIDAGKIEINLEDFVLTDTINAVITMVKSLLNKKGHKLEIECDPNIGVIQADNRKFKQVILNFLTNAIKYTPEGGSIIVRASREHGKILVSVTDTGIGIEPEEQEKIFSEFYQVDRIRDESLGGVGIGLALTQRLVKLQGGDIGVESERGKGSTFWFTIPQENMVDEVGNGRDRSLLKGKEKSEKKSVGRRILVAEDNETNLALITEMLKIQNHIVTIVRNGLEAFDMTIVTKPELILMDVRMPKIDGLEVTHRLRQMPEFQNTPIIALSASDGQDAKKRCLDAGCTDYLAKPVKSKELFEMLEKYLK